MTVFTNMVIGVIVDTSSSTILETVSRCVLFISVKARCTNILAGTSFANRGTVFTLAIGRHIGSFRTLA